MGRVGAPPERTGSTAPWERARPGQPYAACGHPHTRSGKVNQDRAGV